MAQVSNLWPFLFLLFAIEIILVDYFKINRLCVIIPFYLTDKLLIRRISKCCVDTRFLCLHLKRFSPVGTILLLMARTGNCKYWDEALREFNLKISFFYLLIVLLYISSYIFLFLHIILYLFPLYDVWIRLWFLITIFSFFALRRLFRNSIKYVNTFLATTLHKISNYGALLFIPSGKIFFQYRIKSYLLLN